MQVLVIGSSSGVGRLLVDACREAGHEVRAMVRDPGQAADLEAAGAEVVVGDLEGSLDGVFDGVDAVAFCAGSGSATGADATLRVDLHGAVRTFDACRDHGVRRYVLLSSNNSHDPLAGPETMRHYLAAMHARERLLWASDLDATVVRPGRLNHDEGTGRVRLEVPRIDDRGEIPRADVAAVMAACLDDDATIGAVFGLLGGDTPIEDALASLH